ncbi:MAG: prenyltransferase/squalene oxidase repeat-containing protein, partial [Planctomyces sp.]
MNQRNENGHWTGELSTSALSTATAVMALLLVTQPLKVPLKDDGHTASSDHIAEGRRRKLVQGGLSWLAAHQNADGGWGDTTLSVSNISTTMLVHAVFVAAGRSELKAATPTEGLPTTSATEITQGNNRAAIIAAADAYIRNAGGVPALLKRYGKDHTFSVPILTHCALAGTVDWKHVIPLPFELSCIPAKFYAAVRMPVVSYALPALIAIGQVIFHHQGHRNPLIRWIRRRSISRSLRVLESIQPENGGFLEATPLTSFVCMSLLGCGLFNHPVTKKCLRFIEQSVRSDGSWPIDTNLTTWVTTLSINALSQGETSGDCLNSNDRQTLRMWLLEQQYRCRHPYTNAAPGGWSWTNLPGGVPDADDTPGAMLALMNLRVQGEEFSQEELEALNAAAGWLLDLQNRDGGWPTFCRGWGTLPFDRSSCDLTAHTIRALRRWLQILANSRPHSESGEQVRAHRAIM